eukprot:2009604-Pyramimonas_sp.AAC.1
MDAAHVPSGVVRDQPRELDLWRGLPCPPAPFGRHPSSVGPGPEDARRARDRARETVMALRDLSSGAFAPLATRPRAGAAAGDWSRVALLL